MKKFCLIALVLLCSFGLTSQAFAQGLPSGLSVTFTGNSDLDADFDVALNTALPLPVASPSVGRLGNEFYSPTYYYLAQMQSPALNALDAGDGSTPVSNTTIPLATAGAPPGTPNVFRGSFTHTYPSQGDYVMTVGKNSLMGYVGSTVVPVTSGNALTGNTFAFSVYSPFAGSTVTLSFTLTAPFNLGLTNTTVASLSSPTVDVPTASGAGLVLLMLLLAGAGVVLLRR